MCSVGGSTVIFFFFFFLRIPLDLAFFPFPIQMTSEAGLS